MNKEHILKWPQKHNLIGVAVSETIYDEASSLIIYAAQKHIPVTITHLAVHGLVTASADPSFKSKVNSFDIVAPDGQPVRWALNILYGTKLQDRVCGHELMLRLYRRAAEADICVYFYGSRKCVVEKLRENLIKRFPSLQIVGYEPSVFRPLTQEEDEALVERINRSGAGLVFLGLGCPLQEVFAYEHRHSINAVQICVGAAFDFLSGNKKIAPRWMQMNGLEWLFRLMTEPRRLWRRYLVTNTIFLIKLFLQITRLNKFNIRNYNKIQ